MSVSKILSKASGLSEDKVKKIWEEVKLNSLTLEGCSKPHDFSIPLSKDDLVREYVCSKCGGKISVVHKLWYERGLEHARLDKSNKSS